MSIAGTHISSAFSRIGDLTDRFVRHYIPNAFLFAILLTFLTMIMAWLFTSNSPTDVVALWGEGFWFVIAFSMQSVLLLMTGWALADSPPVKKILRYLASFPNSQFQAIMLMAIIGVTLGLFHWGVVLIGAAIFARELGVEMERQDIDVHYPLLVATAYAGLFPWHQGLSSTTALLVATEDHFLADVMGVVPVSETIFTFTNLVLVSITVLLIIIIMPMLAPEEDIKTVPEETLRMMEHPLADGGTDVPSDESRLKSLLLDSRVIGVGTGLLFWAYLIYLFSTNPFMESFTLNTFIVILFATGFLLHTTLRSYIGVVRDAIHGASQIIIQFQFYGGIMGIMALSGLAEKIALTLAAHSTAETWYASAYIASAIINFFVPAGGGQWIVTGEVLVKATQEIPGAEVGPMMIAFVMGDQSTNLIQPFWAIPVLAIAGLSVRDILGYTGVLFIILTIVQLTGTLLMGYGIL
jgi:short-chain fatty acids transporter